MASEINENSPLRQLSWDAVSIPVSVGNINWELSNEQMNALLEEVEPAAVPVDTLSFNQLCNIVSYLFNNGYDTRDLRVAVNEWYVTERLQKKQESVEVDRQIQEALGKLVSPQDSEPYIIIDKDGLWGPASENALQFIQRAYNLDEIKRNIDLVKVLRNLASRIIRINCPEDYKILDIQYNPFCIIDNSSDDYEVRSTGKSYIIYDAGAGNRIAVFSPETDPGGVFYKRFSACWMLLRMATDKPRNKVFVLIDDHGRRQNFNMQPDKSGSAYGNDLHVELMLDLNNLKEGIKVQYGDLNSDAILYTAFISRHMTMSIIPGEMKIDIDGFPTWHFPVPDFMQEEVAPFGNGNYVTNSGQIKIFAVRKDFKGNAANKNFISLSETNLPADFYRLISAYSEDIFDQVSIVLTEKQTQIPYNGKTVVVVGTGHHNQLSQKEKDMSIAMGTALAHNGYGLISGTWPGVDDIVTNAYIDQFSLFEDLHLRLTHVTDGQHEAFTQRGTIVNARNDKEWNRYVLDRAAVVIIIGGKQGTRNIFDEAVENKVPIIPIASTGGVAGYAWTILTRKNVPYLKEFLPATISALLNPLDIDVTAEQKAAFVISTLDRLTTNKMSKKEFKKKVEQIYRERDISVDIDIQKHRWGGRASSNGKTLMANVTKYVIPGFFSVELMVKADNPDKYSGYTAFMLHQSFGSEIEIVEVKDGICSYEVTAYEAFTAAAYTEDGTMLELDMDEEIGYPEGFYSQIIPESFKTEAAKLDKSRKVSVEDDPEKNRWGGQTISSNKEAKATVSGSIVPGYFRVKVSVSSTDPAMPFVGEVAFFLHDSFEDRIVYARAVSGIAKISFLAYEAFTVGIYTSDKTMLELDLQQQTGYPKNFYYKEVTTKTSAPKIRKKK
ncbi:pYEATS domain-containing protein [Chitinophaga sp.]|uniref:pYEATS domain-containing protein n=1 Tax=Chitinophaga sp. TaxID=1869181 RepID=UPI0031D813B7